MKSLARYIQSTLLALLPSPDYIALDKPTHWRYIGHRRRFNQSKYMPHQGAQECKRRR